MRTRSFIAVSALLLATLGLSPVRAAAAASCLGKPATHVMHAGEGTYHGTASDDVVVGTPGADSISLIIVGGIDLVCGFGGNDTIFVFGPGSFVDGGAGNDNVAASDGATARGGAGDDFVEAIDAGSRAEGGSGHDQVLVIGAATGDGGSGNDAVSGFNAAALNGGSGGDAVANESGNPAIDCGSGDDTVRANGATTVRRCETRR
jgi:Ca2+-binding RTX toxin-like protein